MIKTVKPKIKRKVEKRESAPVNPLDRAPQELEYTALEDLDIYNSVLVKRRAGYE